MASILIEAPKGARVLVDGGGSLTGEFDTGARIVTPFLLSRKILRLDYVINSHAHQDHIGGLVSVLSTFNVRTFAGTPHLVGYPGHAALLETVERQHTKLEYWKRGDVIPLSAGTEMAVLHPRQGVSFENLNDASLVVAIEHKGERFLMPGDIGAGVEEELLQSGASLRARVLKIPHHGSAGSSTYAFLRAVSPQLALLSGGGIMPGLPSPEIIERYRLLSIPVLRTDRQGPITVCYRNNRLTYRVAP